MKKILSVVLVMLMFMTILSSAFEVQASELNRESEKIMFTDCKGENIFIEIIEGNS